MTALAEATWPEVGTLAGDGAVLVVPVGATEQHGPHLPITTDTEVAEAVCARAARLDPGLVVAPAVAYGSSGEHQDFPGTLSIGQEATELLLVELCRSAPGAFAHVVLACAHGGNAGPLARAVGRLVAEGRPVAAWWPRWGGDLHAGATETSVMLAIAPDRVRLARAEAGDRRPAAEIQEALAAHGVAAVSANGVLGDPAGASADAGEALLEAAAADLVAAADALRSRSAPVGSR